MSTGMISLLPKVLPDGFYSILPVMDGAPRCLHEVEENTTSLVTRDNSSVKQVLVIDCTKYYPKNNPELWYITFNSKTGAYVIERDSDVTGGPGTLSYDPVSNNITADDGDYYESVSWGITKNNETAVGMSIVALINNNPSQGPECFTLGKEFTYNGTSANSLILSGCKNDSSQLFKFNPEGNPIDKLPNY